MSVKVGVADGGVDVTQVIATIGNTWSGSSWSGSRWSGSSWSGGSWS